MFFHVPKPKMIKSRRNFEKFFRCFIALLGWDGSRLKIFPGYESKTLAL